jgi:DNA-binding NarL/FixJ family response regulator
MAWKRTVEMQNAEAMGEDCTLTREEKDLLAQTRILGDAEHGLTVTEIARLLNLQPSSVKIYLRTSKRRIDLYRRLFEEDQAIKEQAIALLEARRAS